MSQKICFTPYHVNIEDIILPKRFTFPYCYEPHPLCLLAVEALQQKLQKHQVLQQELAQTGKMFGVLIVKNSQGEIGYLNAFSGKLTIDENSHKDSINFVPAVVDLDGQGDCFYDENKIINIKSVGGRNAPPIC